MAPFVDILVREAVRSLTESRIQGSVPTNTVQVTLTNVGARLEGVRQRRSTPRTGAQGGGKCLSDRPRDRQDPRQGILFE